MWKRKSNVEIEAEEIIAKQALSKKRLNDSIKFFIITFTICIASSLFESLTGKHGRINPNYETPLSLAESIKKTYQDLPFAIGLSFLGFIYGYFFHGKIFTKRNSNTYMCEKCNYKTNGLNESGFCKCGEKYYPLNYFKWTEETN